MLRARNCVIYDSGYVLAVWIGTLKGFVWLMPCCLDPGFDFVHVEPDKTVQLMERDRAVVDPGVERGLLYRQKVGNRFDGYQLHRGSLYQDAAVLSMYRDGATF